MINQALMIEWGMPIEGRESMALEVFSSHVQWWTELKTKDRIKEFRTYGMLTGDFSTRSGFVMVEGTIEQIDELRHSEEFRTRLNDVLNIVRNVHITTLETGELMMKRMMRYGESIKKMGR